MIPPNRMQDLCPCHELPENPRNPVICLSLINIELDNRVLIGETRLYACIKVFTITLDELVTRGGFPKTVRNPGNISNEI